MDKKQTLDRINEAAARIIEIVGVLRHGADDDDCIRRRIMRTAIFLGCLFIELAIENIAETKITFSEGVSKFFAAIFFYFSFYGYSRTF